jgi:DNA-binding response OmpR family regulator
MEITDNCKSVLIIDDDVDFLMMLSVILNNRGFKVRCLLDGEDHSFFEYARKSDIVLIDIKLPGVNGCDLGKQLKSDSQTEDIPVILISGDPDEQRISRNGVADAFIKKPFALSGLLHKIDELLSADQSHAQGIVS